MIWTFVLLAGATAFGDADLQEDARRASRPAPTIVAPAVANAACIFPGAPPQAKIVMFSTYDADTLSSVAIGGPDEETNLMDVVIEPGREPLYLILSSHESMLWRVSGATRRLVKIVVSSGQGERRSIPLVPISYPRPGSAPRVSESWTVPARPREDSASGVLGIERSRVHIAKTNCPGYSDTASKAGARAGETVRVALGRAPDIAFADYSASSVTLPPGRISQAPRGAAPAPPGFDPETWQDAARYWPGGLAQVRARNVVSAFPAEPYAVLPSQMGLSQLVGSGAARRIDRDTFRVDRPIPHMPPSMGGAHSVRLIFARGVPVPPGHPGHSCIIREGQGDGIGPRCQTDSD